MCDRLGWDALKFIKAWEAKKNRKDNENQAKMLGLGGVGGKWKRAAECDQTEKLTLLKLKKASKASRAAIVRVVVAKLQASLSRYHLRKRARGVFSFVATATNFRALVSGYAPVQQHANGKLFCKVGGASKSEILNTLSSILGESDHWFARRYYGPDFKSSRDCAFLKFDPTVRRDSSSCSSARGLILRWRRTRRRDTLEGSMAVLSQFWLASPGGINRGKQKAIF
jgi:hypothetical protein